VEKKWRFVCPLRQKKRLLPKGGADCHAGVAIWLLKNRTPYPILERMRLRAVSAAVYDLAKVLFEFWEFGSSDVCSLGTALSRKTAEI